MSRHHILVVDDDPGIRFAMALKLRSCGFDVSEATDGVEALAFLDTNHADLVVLDVGMPRLDGYSVARRLHADPRTAALPVLILTAQNLDVPADVAPSIGPHRFLTKPFSPRLVVEAIRELLQEA